MSVEQEERIHRVSAAAKPYSILGEWISFAFINIKSFTTGSAGGFACTTQSRSERFGTAVCCDERG